MSQLKHAASEEERNLQNRELAMHVYELLDDSAEMLGKKLRKALSWFPDKEFLVGELNQLNAFHRVIFKMIGVPLREIRHNSAAHKTKKALELNKHIASVEVDAIENYVLMLMIFSILVFSFQENILLSLRLRAETIEAQEAEALRGKRRTIVRESRKLILIVHGVNPALAEVLLRMDAETIRSLQEVREILNQPGLSSRERVKIMCSKLPFDFVLAVHDWSPRQRRYLRRMYSLE